MPMRAELYPENWSVIALTIKANANWTCQLCHKPCIKSGDSTPGLSTSEKARRILSVHHRDRNPTNNHASNLMALCTPCHLGVHRGDRYGRKVHPDQLALLSPQCEILSQRILHRI